MKPIFAIEFKIIRMKSKPLQVIWIAHLLFRCLLTKCGMIKEVVALPWWFVVYKHILKADISMLHWIIVDFLWQHGFFLMD